MLRGERELLDIAHSDNQLMHFLEMGREVDLPEWYICAGVIRDTVWNHLHGIRSTKPHDIDFIFFMPKTRGITPSTNDEVQKRLSKIEPSVFWDAMNSALGYTWKSNGMYSPPSNSSEEFISQFPEIASCVGLRLTKKGNIEVCAPFGLDELMNMVFKRNPNSRTATPEGFKK